MGLQEKEGQRTCNLANRYAVRIVHGSHNHRCVRNYETQCSTLCCCCLRRLGWRQISMRILSGVVWSELNERQKKIVFNKPWQVSVARGLVMQNGNPAGNRRLNSTRLNLQTTEWGTEPSARGSLDWTAVKNVGEFGTLDQSAEWAPHRGAKRSSLHG